MKKPANSASYHYPIPDLCGCSICRDDRKADILRYVMHADALPHSPESLKWWQERRKMYMAELENA